MSQRKLKKHKYLSGTFYLFLTPTYPPKEHVSFVKPPDFLTWPLSPSVVFGRLKIEFADVRFPLNISPVILAFCSPVVCFVIFFILVGPTSIVTALFEVNLSARDERDPNPNHNTSCIAQSQSQYMLNCNTC